MSAHATYTFLFNRALHQGQFPVRWVEWIGIGESQPLFNFYPPGLYYLVEVVYAFGMRLSKALEATVLLLWWLGAAFTFLWMRPLGWLPGAFGAFVFAFSPYVIVDVFVRAAYPELAAVALAPGILWSIDRVIRSGRMRDVVLVAVLVGSMLITHLLSSLIIGPVIAAYAVHRAFAMPRSQMRAVLARLALAALIGVGLATFYLLPSMYELHDVAITRMTSGSNDYAIHFVAPQQWWSGTWGYGASVAGVGDGLSFRIALVQFAIAVGALGFVIAGRLTGRRTAHAGQILFWVLVMAAAMFLMTDASAAIWRRVSALAYLQFPWRYFMLISIATAALAALLLSAITNRTVQALVAIALVAWHYTSCREHLQPLDYVTQTNVGRHVPGWKEMELPLAQAFLERGFTPVAAREPVTADIGRWMITGDANVVERRIADDRLLLDVEASTATRLRINSHYFPGWHASVDGIDVPIDVVPRYGFMEIALEPGAHSVAVRFENSPIRTLSNAITLASLAACVALAVIIRP